ncbi:MAG: hypothetical protein E7474_06570 [Ruminococcaceae bacterium]|nr:hypothetical protein [Oscillospiraceae bacterium]
MSIQHSLNKQMNHYHKGSQGIDFMSLKGIDKVVSVVKYAELLIFVSSDGYLLCVKSEFFSPLNRGTGGRWGMRPGSGQTIINTFSLNADQYQLVEEDAKQEGILDEAVPKDLTENGTGSEE